MNRRFVSLTGAAVLAAASTVSALVQIGGRPAEDWIARLERPDRVAGLKTAEVTEKLGLKPGDIVADIGAGAGAFSWPFARAVAPGGKVYAVEVDKGYIPHLEKRIAEQQLTNVKPVLGKYEDPLLPEKVDVAFFHDVVHHVANRGEYLKTVASYLKPQGRIAVIELDATRPDSSHRDEPEMQVTKEQLESWMTAAGLKKLEEHALYEDKWFVVYGKAGEKK